MTGGRRVKFHSGSERELRKLQVTNNIENLSPPRQRPEL